MYKYIYTYIHTCILIICLDTCISIKRESACFVPDIIRFVLVFDLFFSR